MKSNILPSKHKILLVTNLAWNVFKFRLPFITYIQTFDINVDVLTEFDGYEQKLHKKVNNLFQMNVNSRSINIFSDLRMLFTLWQTYKASKPDLIILYTIKPCIYGSIVARLMGIPVIMNITGMGSGFLRGGLFAKAILLLYKLGAGKNTKLVFQNQDDQELFLNNKIISHSQANLIQGSGISLKDFPIAPYPKNREFVFLMVARLIKDKGIGEYIEAAKILLNKSLKIKFQILGKVQESINSNFSKKHIDSLHESGVIEYLGESDDVKKYIISADCVVLPSYREGTSKALLEGHAMGRPLIASNVSGCKEIILHNKSGLLCEAKDSLDLASKMLQMTKKSRSERKKMGILGREKVKNEFSEEIVFSKMSKLISTII